MFEGEGNQSRPQIRDGGDMAGVAATVDQRGHGAVERKRAVLRNAERECRGLGWKGNRLAKDCRMIRQNGADGVHIGCPAPQPAAPVPISPDLPVIVYAESACPPRVNAVRVGRDDFQIG